MKFRFVEWKSSHVLLRPFAFSLPPCSYEFPVFNVRIRTDIEERMNDYRAPQPPCRSGRGERIVLSLTIEMLRTKVWRKWLNSMVLPTPQQSNDALRFEYIRPVVSLWKLIQRKEIGGFYRKRIYYCH